MIDFINDSQNLFQTCTSEDYPIITEILQAVSKLENNDEAFSYFDLALSDYDLEVLSKIRITSFQDLSLFGLQNLHAHIEPFLKSFALEHEDNILATHISKLVIKLTRSIMATSNYDDAEFTIRTYSFDPNYFPLWHVDKRHEEIVYPFNNLTYLDNQYAFVFSLKGPSTIFYTDNAEIRENWNLQANESFYGYGYDSFANYVKGESLDKMVDIAKTSSAIFGHGSVHIAGRKNGAIHAAPDPQQEGRLIVMVTPGKISLLKTIEKLEKEHYSKN